MPIGRAVGRAIGKAAMVGSKPMRPNDYGGRRLDELIGILGSRHRLESKIDNYPSLEPKWLEPKWLRPTGKLPLSLPSPRASDPVGLDRSRVYIFRSETWETPNENSNKCDANWVILFLSCVFNNNTMRNHDSVS